MAERYAIIPLPDYGPAPADAIVVGTLSDVTSYLPQSVERKELEEILDEVGRVRDRAKQLVQYERDFTNKVAAFSAECDARLASLDTRQHRLDAKRKQRKAREQQEQIQSYLDALPDADDIPGVHHPGGELHTIGPVDKEHLDPELDDAGGVPLSYGNVPMSYIKGKRDAEGDLPKDLEKRTPSGLGNYPTYDPKELGRAQDPKQVPQPVSVSLNAEE